MTPGLFGYSLLFELLVFYFALAFLFTKTPKHWVALGLLVLVLFAFTDLSPSHWVELFSGTFDVFWKGILGDFRL